MSFSLFARPAPVNVPAPVYFGPSFKFAVAEVFYRDGNDGSLRRDILLIENTSRNYAILDGMIAATGKGNEVHKDAMKLRQMLDDNPQGVEIWIGDWNDHGDTEPVDDEPDESDEPSFDPVKAGYVTKCCGARLVTEAPGSGDLTSICENCKDRSPEMVPPSLSPSEEDRVTDRMDADVRLSREPAGGHGAMIRTIHQHGA